MSAVQPLTAQGAATSDREQATAAEHANGTVCTAKDTAKNFDSTAPRSVVPAPVDETDDISDAEFLRLLARAPRISLETGFQLEGIADRYERMAARLAEFEAQQADVDALVEAIDELHTAVLARADRQASALLKPTHEWTPPDPAPSPASVDPVVTEGVSNG